VPIAIAACRLPRVSYTPISAVGLKCALPCVLTTRAPIGRRNASLPIGSSCLTAMLPLMWPALSVLRRPIISLARQTSVASARPWDARPDAHRKSSARLQLLKIFISRARRYDDTEFLPKLRGNRGRLPAV